MTPAEFASWLPDPHRRPLVMGVLNVTPDSFSDGGDFANVDRAVSHAFEMLAAGADLLDVGGESTRPGSARVTSAVQIERIVPVTRAIASRSSASVTVSIDTTQADVARAAIDAGATLINDVSAGTDDAPGMFALAGERRVPIILMHMLGSPLTMQNNPSYPNDDVVGAVERYFFERLSAARVAGIAESNVLLDPGIGFGKTLAHNLALLRHTARLAAIGRPVSRPLVVGASRKHFIGTITGEREPAQRTFGTAAAVAHAIANGAAIVRVHDVRPMAQVVRMIRAIQTGTIDEAGPASV